MRKASVIVSIFFLPLFLSGQNLLDEFLATSSTSAPQAQSSLETHINALQKRRPENEIAFLHKIFSKTQRTFLKKYEPYVSFDALFSGGQYDCLTATSLYSIVLEKFNFNYDIIETNYHIFILVHAAKGDVLLETTDRFNGFVTDARLIEQRIGVYQQNLIASKKAGLQYYDFSFDLYRKVNPTQLAGLLHFNQAVNAFNRKDWRACAAQLELSAKKYETPRVKELAILLVKSVLASDANDEIRHFILQQFKSYWIGSEHLAAAN